MSTQANKIEIHHLLQAPSLNIAEFKEWVNSDPVLSAFILDAVNTPLFNLPEKVVTVYKAIDLLGIGQIQELLLQQLALTPLNFSINPAQLPTRNINFAEKHSA